MIYYNRKPLSVINIIIGINVVFFIPWIMTAITRNPVYFGELMNFCALNINKELKYTVENYSYWQIITSMFIHGNLYHLIFNMYGLFMFGKPLEYMWGNIKFSAFYLISGILANIASIIFLNFTNSSVSLIGASGAIMAVLLGFGSYYPDAQLLLFFIIPLKVKWAILIFAGLELLFEVTGTFSGIAHFTHLFGLLFGFLYLLVFFKINSIKEMFFKDTHRFNGFS